MALDSAPTSADTAEVTSNRPALNSGTFKTLVLSGNQASGFVSGRLALPIATYPGLALTGASVREVVTNSEAQAEAQASLHARYGLPIVLSAMDLSTEAEAFGCELHLTDSEIPSILAGCINSLQQARHLAVPQPGDKRTSVYLETVRRLKKLPGSPLVLGGCIGPFSLAARLVGVSQALELTLAEPQVIHAALEKSTQFLKNYTRAFRDAGADGVIMAEPAAGLLSPRGVSLFSSPYVREIVSAFSSDARGFALVLHNCAAKLTHLPAILESGVGILHFGSPMDMVQAFSKVPPDVILCGNLDPTGIFCQLPPDQVAQRRAELLAATAAFPNFVISSGCDLPPGTPLAALDAFYGR